MKDEEEVGGKGDAGELEEDRLQVNRPSRGEAMWALNASVGLEVGNNGKKIYNYLPTCHQHLHPPEWDWWMLDQLTSFDQFLNAFDQSENSLAALPAEEEVTTAEVG